MSPPRQPSRDPRLNRGPPGAPSTLLRPAPARAQEDNPKFVQSISDLIHSAVKAGSVQAEKDKLKKSQELCTGLLQKAQEQKSFPCLTEYFQQASDEDKANLGRVEEALREHTSRFERLLRDLRTQWTTSINSISRVDEKRLEDEVRTAKEEAAQAKAEVSRLTTTNQSLEKKIEELVGRMDKMEQASSRGAASVKDLSETSNKLETALDKLDSGELPQEVTTKLCQNVTARLQPQIDGIKYLSTKLNGRVAEIENKLVPLENLPLKIQEMDELVQDHAKMVTQSNVDKTVKLYKQISSIGPRLEAAEAYGPRLEAVEAKLNRPEEPGAVSNGSSHPQTGPHLSDSEFREFVGVQKLKDDLLSAHVAQVESSVEEVQKQLDELKDENRQRSGQIVTLQAEFTKFPEQIAAAKAQATRVSDDLKSLQPVASEASVQQLWGHLSNLQQHLESVRVGVHSLETRYNNLSTEPVVKSMVVAMQEMYPSAGQLTEQVNKLRELVEGDLPALKQRMDQLSEIESDHFNQWQHVAAQRLDDINRLKNDHTSLNQTLTPLWERHNAEGKLPSEEDMKDLRAELDLLKEKLGGLASQTTETKTPSTLCREDNSTVKALETELKKLGDQFVSTNTGNSATLKALEIELKKLADELAQTKSSNSETFESHGHDLKALSTAIEEVEGKVLEAVEKALADTMSQVLQSNASQPNESQSQEIELPAPVPVVQEGLVENWPTDENGSLLPKKKKKKRVRPPGFSDDERLSLPPGVSNALSSPQLGGLETPVDGSRRKKRKKKADAKAEARREDAILIEDD